MSAFKHALAARDAHIRTLHITLVALFLTVRALISVCTVCPLTAAAMYR